MVYSWEISELAQQTEQLIDIASVFIQLGKVDSARKIARKLIEGHRERLSILSKVAITSENDRAVFDELNEIQYLTGN